MQLDLTIKINSAVRRGSVAVRSLRRVALTILCKAYSKLIALKTSEGVAAAWRTATRAIVETHRFSPDAEVGDVFAADILVAAIQTAKAIVLGDQAAAKSARNRGFKRRADHFAADDGGGKSRGKGYGGRGKGGKGSRS